MMSELPNFEYNFKYRPGAKKLLPSKLVFDLWIEWGTVPKVTQILQGMGYKSKNGVLGTGIVKHTLDCYIVDNYKFCKDAILDRIYRTDNTTLSDTAYELWIVKTAFRLWQKSNPSRLELWLAAHPDLLNKEFYDTYRSYLDTLKDSEPGPGNIIQGFIVYVLEKQMSKV